VIKFRTISLKAMLISNVWDGESELSLYEKIVVPLSTVWLKNPFVVYDTRLRKV
jgi:hypothetical protein